MRPDYEYAAEDVMTEIASLRERIRQLEQAAAGATTRTEWGVRYDEQGNVGIYGTGSDHERWARMDADGVLVCRTVTYGPWLVPDGG